MLVAIYDRSDLFLNVASGIADSRETFFFMVSVDFIATHLSVECFTIAKKGLSGHPLLANHQALSYE